MAILACIIAAQADQNAFASLEQRFAQANKPPYDRPALIDINQQVMKLIDRAAIQPTKFSTAANLISDFRFRLELARVKYELTLCSVAMEPEKFASRLARAWDGVLLSTGRAQRVGSFQWPGSRFRVSPAPLAIQRVMRNPKPIAGKGHHHELIALAKSDQDARTKNWSQLTQIELDQLQKADKSRRELALKIVKSASSLIAAEFHAAAIVLQHGESWNDFVLAHELAACAMMLGDKGAVWLCAASYDRMMVSAGYPQRFLTQYGSDDLKEFRLEPYETLGINDQMRMTMECPSLAEAIGRQSLGFNSFRGLKGKKG